MIIAKFPVGSGLRRICGTTPNTPRKIVRRFSMSLYLVTGGAGFIGHQLARDLLEEGHSLRVVDDLSNARAAPQFKCDFIRASLAAPDADLKAWLENVDGCFHLAATASVERSETEWRAAHDANLVGGLALLRAAAGTGRDIPVVYASSAAVYGEPASDEPLGEDAPTRPRGAYGADKLALELHARAIGARAGQRSAAARIFNAFGEGQDPSSPYSGVIAIFLGDLAARRDLTVFGDGGQSRDFVHVRDVSCFLRAMLAAATAASPAWNVCSGRATTIAGLARRMTELADAGSGVCFGAARTGEARSVIGCPEGAARDLGLRARTSLDEGLSDLLRDL